MFSAKFKELSKEKRSHLCVGLDPVCDTREEILAFCLATIEEVAESAAAVKPNTQFIFPLSDSEMRKVARHASEHGLATILDHKLSDIGNSNASAVRWISRCGFDAFTFSPFPGDFSTITEAARAGLDTFTLALMSNPEAGTFMKAPIAGEEAYSFVCRKVVEHDGCGCVVGATCAPEDVRTARRILGERLILVPGIGAQGGALEALRNFGHRSVVNVGRDIIAAKDQKKKAEEYRQAIEDHLGG